MDLDYFVTRHRESLFRAGSAPCVSSRASHRALAAGYAERIRLLRDVPAAGTLAIAA